jgi:hypothetical protein
LSSNRTKYDPVATALWLADQDDISAVEQEEAMFAEREEIDRLLESVDRELIEEQAEEGVRMWLDAVPPARVRRTRRRAEKAKLRALPTRLGRDWSELGEEAA